MCLRVMSLVIVVLAAATVRGQPTDREQKLPDAKSIDELIGRLGSANFQEREAATRALDAIGYSALPRLREAAAGASDAEARRRAKRLVEAIENQLESLLHAYKAYGLPVPPAESPLVRFEAGGGGKVNGVVQPIEYSLAFQLAPATADQGPELLRGRLRYRTWSGASCTVLDPTRATPEQIKAWLTEVDAEDALLLAIQCKVRGWDNLVQAFYEKAQGPKAKHRPLIALRLAAWYYWQGELTEPRTDWPDAARQMHALIDAEPTLQIAAHRALLKSLDAALVPSKAKPGSIEALIDRLVCVTSIDLQFIDDVDPTYLGLIEAGFTAVPELLKHLDDDRLTRIYTPGFNLSPGHHCRVGDLVQGLLMGLAGGDLRFGDKDDDTPKVLREWWTRAQKVGEEGHACAHAVAEGEWPNFHLVYLLEKKYPQRLPEVYRTLLDSRPKMVSWPVAAALARCKAPWEKKVELFAYAGRSKSLEHARMALGHLSDLDPPRFVEVLTAALDELPKSPRGPHYWMCDEQCFASLVCYAKDRRAWQALERAAKRADVGLRLQFLERVGESEAPDARAARLDFLAAFLDDSTPRDLGSDRERYSGFPAGHDFPQLEVRNFAAQMIAEVLRLDRKPEPAWTAEQWAELRSFVRKELKRLK